MEAKKKDVTQLLTRELNEYVNRLEKISSNPTVLKALPDKGAKVKVIYEKAKCELLNRNDLDEITESLDRLKIQKIEFGSSPIWCQFNQYDSDDDNETAMDRLSQAKTKEESSIPLKQNEPCSGLKRKIKTIQDSEKPLKYDKTSNPYQETFPLYNFDKMKALDLEESFQLINEHRIKLKEAEETLKTRYTFQPEASNDFSA